MIVAGDLALTAITGTRPALLSFMWVAGVFAVTTGLIQCYYLNQRRNKIS